MARPQPRKAKAPAQHHPVEGQQATCHHPAGDVVGTLTTVARQYVLLTIQRHGGLEPLTLKFTLRPDGEYRAVGQGNSARPALSFTQ